MLYNIHEPEMARKKHSAQHNKIICNMFYHTGSNNFIKLHVKKPLLYCLEPQTDHTYNIITIKEQKYLRRISTQPHSPNVIFIFSDTSHKIMHCSHFYLTVHSDHWKSYSRTKKYTIQCKISFKELKETYNAGIFMRITLIHLDIFASNEQKPKMAILMPD